VANRLLLFTRCESDPSQATLIRPEGFKVSPGVSVPLVIVTVRGGVPSIVVMVKE